MFKRKSLSCVVISLLLTLFLTNNVYADLQNIIQNMLPFTDVQMGDWYYADVKEAYDKKLINGKTNTLFAPNDNLTAAEAVKLAACMHQLKNEGRVNFPLNSTPWYKPYVDYAREKNIITTDLAWNSKIDRAGYMEVFAKIITGAEANLNNIEDGTIPDVPMNHPNANSIYKLYRAGIVQGVDAAGNCNPKSFIKRSEVATILTRMMNESRRISSDAGNLTITEQPQNAAGRLGENVQLKVAVNGGKEPIKYQWQYVKVGDTEYKNSTSEGNTDSILKPPVEEITYEYRCVITDANGKQVISNNAKVEIEPSSSTFRIMNQPKGVVANIGDMAVLEVRVAGGKEPIKYQWQYIVDFETSKYFNSKAEGNTTNILKTPVEETVYGYRCVITDADGRELISNTVRVEKGSGAFAITKQPISVAKKIGTKVKLDIIAGGGKQPLTYQWKYASRYGMEEFSDSKAEGNKTNVLTVPVENEPYKYYCEVTDADGNKVRSNVALVSPNIW